MKRLVVFSFFSVLLIILVRLGLNQGYLRLPLSSSTTSSFPLPQASPEEITAKINTYRLSHNLAALTANPAICQFDPPNASGQSPTSDFLSRCPTCSKVSLITVSRFVSPNELLTAFINDDSINQTLLSKDVNFLCPLENSQDLLLFFASLQEKTVTPIVAAPQRINPTPKITANPPNNFSESELWTALTQYRSSHQRSTLTKDEALCTYAKKRLNDQIKLMGEKKPSEYPVPDKYPLDAHAGFSSDAENGIAFDIAGKNNLAENLAYWPDAQYPHQVIEWGWDSSTEGHRETQLSNDWTVGCISSRDGFYVAIFGY